MPRLHLRALAAACFLSLPASLAAASAATPVATPPPYVPPPYVAETPDPNIPAYDDASVHFAAPSGWRKVELEPDPQNPESPIVAFIEPVKYDGSSIAIAVADYSQTLERFDTDHEQEIRGASGYIEHSGKERLANGMPAYFVQSSSGDGTNATRRFEWLVFDGRRSIMVTEISRRGVVDEATARKLLSTLTVVVYPGKR